MSKQTVVNMIQHHLDVYEEAQRILRRRHFVLKHIDLGKTVIVRLIDEQGKVIDCASAIIRQILDEQTVQVNLDEKLGYFEAQEALCIRTEDFFLKRETNTWIASFTKPL